MLSLLSTPSGGLNEVLYALHKERGAATSEGGVDYHRLLRHLPPRIDTGDIDTILATAVTDGYATSSGAGFVLTTLGQIYVRANHPRRSRITVA
jgi:hypothetical protein